MLNQLLARYDVAGFRARIEEHPLVALGAALAAGLVAGFQRGTAGRWLRRELAQVATAFAGSVLVDAVAEYQRKHQPPQREHIVH